MAQILSVSVYIELELVLLVDLLHLLVVELLQLRLVLAALVLLLLDQLLEADVQHQLRVVLVRAFEA